MTPKVNLFVKILITTWERFKKEHPSYATPYYDSIIDKVIHCRDPKFGYVEYLCMQCGLDFHRVGFSCKNGFCIHCARKRSNDFIEEIMGKLHPGVVYRHLVLTIPEQLRKFFYKNRISPDLYNHFIDIGRDYVDDIFRHVTKIKDLKTGCVIVIHTAGRKGNFNPHLHIIVMAGGIDPSTGLWVNLPYFKYENLMPKKWQYHLLKMIKSFDPSTADLVKMLWKKYEKGFVNKFKKGDVPKKMGHLIKYLSKYISKPSISIRSILIGDFDNEMVTYKYRDHRIKRDVVTTCDFITFIGRLAQQILPKGFHRIRYFGIQHPSGYQKRFREINEGLKKINQNVENSDSFVAYAIGNWKWAGDPRKCSFCGHEMEVSKIWSKKYGLIYDIFFDLLKNGTPPPIEEMPCLVLLNPEFEFLDLGVQLSFAV